nr:retrotransposon protein, putative, Ty1-copia subclass [Tanacetum cinerariifolium]GEX64302.1 retrotransposon protein, putative, Ty1-copia subclass [Tanacetum cinerariifolium]
MLEAKDGMKHACNEVACLMLGSMTPELHRKFENYSPYEMLQEHRSMFEKQARVERFDLIQTFHACKQEEGKSVSQYVLKMKGYVEQLKRLGYVLQQDLSIGLILNGLTSDFTGFVRNYNMHNIGKTIGELHSLLIKYEKGLPKKNAKGKGKGKGKGKDKSYIPKPKHPKPNAKEHPEKNDACHHNKKVGHWKRNCPVYLAELMKNKKQVGSASSSGIFIIELYSFPIKSWVYDTGCGTHICITKQGLRGARKLKQGDLYFNGIYEIDMSNPVPNVSFIYNVSNKRVKHNLDSTYLWHRHHAHISKKRIENLQQDGLLKPTDDESFDQCVTCLSGKMTRKSFPHRPERGTDVLGLIHTDVCGPLRHVSRQGAGYFITFTDDYSRYGYIYLLKHKHEVFEMFKVFKNEVENQLGKTIKALRSDRRGEYISQEFKDYLKACGTVQQLTPPYTSQHNGVFERKNRTLLDMVRSMMNLTTLPLSFWDYALDAVPYILNMVQTKKVDKTPYELWFGKVSNLSYLKVWGCEALVKQDMPDKLQQRYVKCIFIGYPKETVGCYFYFLPENKTVVARYAGFFEKNLLSQEVSGKAGDLEEIQHEDTSPSEITSKIPMEVEGFKPPQEEEAPVHRSERPHRAPNRLCLNVEVEEHSLRDLNEPANYKAAISKQNTTAMSATEAEYIAASEAGMEAVWIRKFISGLVEENRVNRPKKYFELSATEGIQADCDVKATNIILQGIPLEVYALVSTHKVAKELWERFQILMQGTSLTKQEKECKLYDEFDKFTYKKGESLLRDLHTTNVDQLHAYLGQHEYHANEYASKAQSSTPLSITYPSNDFQTSVNHNVYNPSSSIPQVEYAPAIALMANLSHYGSDNLAEVHNQDNVTNNVIDQDVRAMSISEQSNIMNQSETKITRDSNIISYSQYVNESQYATVQNSSFPAQQDDLILSVIEQLKTQVLEPKLYDGSVIQKTDAIVIRDSEEILMLEDESRSKMLQKQKDPMMSEKKVNTKPNSRNSEQPNISTSTTIVEVPKELPKVSMVNSSLKKLKFHLASFDMAVKQHCVEKNKFQYKMKDVLKENERLLEQALSTDIVNIVMNANVHYACKTVNECARCEIFQRNNSFSQQSAPTFDQLFEINDLKAQSQEKYTVIMKLKERIKSLSCNVKEEKIKRELEEIEMINIELDHKVTKLVDENEHLKQTYKQLYDSIKSSRFRSKEQCDDLIKQVSIKSAENSDLNASLQEKVLVITALKDTLSKIKGKAVVNQAVPLHPIDPELLKIDVAPLAPKLRNNRTAIMIILSILKKKPLLLGEIFENERLLNPLNTSLHYASVNGKKYILVIVDDYSRPAWVKCLRSKDEAPDFIIKFLKMIQNNVVERRNCTLIEAARTMLIHAQAPLFLWAEAMAITCYTQKRSIIRLRHGKTPYELLHNKLPDFLFLHVFGALCYPTNDSENLGKLQLKADIGIFIGYAPTKKAFRIYNRRTRRIVETIHIDDLLFQLMFDELLNPPPSVDPQAPKVIAPNADVIPPVHAESTGLPFSTTIDQDTPSPMEPKTYKDALTQSCWIEAMQEELNEFERLEVWELVPRPDKVMVISLKWIYKVKLDELGAILKNKARLVARGYRQEEGIDFEESFASKYGFESCDQVDTPMVEKSKLDEDKEGKAVDPSHYRGSAYRKAHTCSKKDLSIPTWNR